MNSRYSSGVVFLLTIAACSTLDETTLLTETAFAYNNTDTGTTSEYVIGNTTDAVNVTTYTVNAMIDVNTTGVFTTADVNATAVANFTDAINITVAINVTAAINTTAEINTTAASNATVGFLPNAREKRYTEYSEYKLGQMLWLYVSPIILLIGIVGNIVSAIVLQTTNMKRTSSSLYLAVLAVSDIILLCMGLLRNWLTVLIDVDVRALHEIVCKIHTFVVYFFTHFSGWLLVAVTVERMVTIYWPLRTRDFCTKRKAAIVIIAIVVILIGIDTHLMVVNGRYTLVYENKTYHYPCVHAHDKYYHFKYKIWPWMDVAIASLIPFGIIMTCNVLIILKLIQARRMRLDTMNLQNQKAEDPTSAMTAMLLTVSFVFVLLTLPIAAFLILDEEQQVADRSQHEVAKAELGWACVNLALYFNSAVNFFLYCLTGRRFRMELIGLLCKHRKSDPIMSKSTATYQSQYRSNISVVTAETRVDSPEEVAHANNSDVKNIISGHDQIPKIQNTHI